AEDLRLLYVALTRARHQTILWWARSKDVQKTALGRLLFGRDEHGAVDPEVLAAEGSAQAATIPPEAECHDHLTRIAARADKRSELQKPVFEVVTLDEVPRGPKFTPTPSS